MGWKSGSREGRIQTRKWRKWVQDDGGKQQWLALGKGVVHNIHTLAIGCFISQEINIRSFSSVKPTNVFSSEIQEFA